MKTIITAGMALFVSMGTAWAGAVTIPNTFYAGNAARAAMVNDNFTEVKKAINDNDGRVTTNASAIATETTRATAADTLHTTNIGANTTNITSNAAAVSSEVTRATAAEGANATSSASNAAAIATETTRATAADTLHTTNIGANTTNISGNTVNISTNASATTVNAIDIGNNTTQIGLKTTEIANEVTRAQAQETLNAAVSSQNATDIYTNQQAIAINAAAVNANSGLLTTYAVDIYANTQAVAGSSPLKVKANGVNIGLLLSYAATEKVVLSPKGYVFNVTKSAVGNDILKKYYIYYSQAGCTGARLGLAYSSSPMLREQPLGDYIQGTVVASRNITEAFQFFYMSKNSTVTAEPATISYMDDSMTPGTFVCRAGGADTSAMGGVSMYVPLLVNDPLVTGVTSSQTFTSPVTIGQ